MRNAGIYIIAVVIWAGCATQTVSEALPPSIAAKMSQQESAWNEGDLEGFMEAAYWKDEQLVFVGSKGATYGFDATLSNYLKSYDSREAMGTLSFELLEWRPLGSQHGFLLGKWNLERQDDLEDLEGHFTLVWEQLPDSGWVIIADHSS